MERGLNTETLAQIIVRCAGVPMGTIEPAELTSVDFDALGVDSLGVMGVVAELENRYQIRLGVDADTFGGPGELLDLVNKMLQDKENHVGAH